MVSLLVVDIARMDAATADLESTDLVRPQNRHLPIPSHQELSDSLGFANGGGQSDSLKLYPGKFEQPFQRDRQLYPSLVSRQLVDLVHDDPFHRPQMLPHPSPDQNGLQSLWSRNQHVWRTASLHGPGAYRRVPVPHLNPNVKVPAHFFQPPQQVTVQRPERSNVQHGDSTGLLLRPRFEKPIQNGQYRRQGLTGPCWRDQQNILTS